MDALDQRPRERSLELTKRSCERIGGERTELQLLEGMFHGADAAILIVLSNDCTFTEDEIRAVPN
jgi:hypothetical protein